MSTKYNYCCQNKQFNSIEGMNSAIPESMRILSDSFCNPSSLQYSTFLTVQSGIANETTTVPVVVGGVIPYVDVGTTPASLTTNQRGINTINIDTNPALPYNAASRFFKYFTPPIPRFPLTPTFICPTRPPSNDPKPSSIPCIPISRFPNSK